MYASDARFRVLLPRLLALYSSTYKRGPLRFKDSHLRLAHVIHAWFLRCERGVEAVLVLDDAGFNVEAAPLRRSVLEHKIGLAWLLEDPATAERVIVRGISIDTLKRKDSIERAGWTSVDLAAFDEVIADGHGLDTSADNQLHFRQRCEVVGSPHDWATYLIETSMSHPCWASALPYLDVDHSARTVQVRPEPLDDMNLGQWAATQMYQALFVVNATLDGNPLSDALAGLRAELLPLVILAREEKGLPIPDDLRNP